MQRTLITLIFVYLLCVGELCAQMAVLSPLVCDLVFRDRKTLAIFQLNFSVKSWH